MGHELRTDTELITKKDLKGPNRKNLNYFDALDVREHDRRIGPHRAIRKTDMMSFIKEDGKGFVGIHAALDTNYKWPEYGEMIGGWFNEHPWLTFNAPIIVEDPNFPAVRHFPHAFVKRDEIYQAKDWSRDKVNVLLSLDPTQARLQQPASASHGSRFRRRLVQDVRQRPRFLFNPRPHEGIVGRSGHQKNVL